MLQFWLSFQTWGELWDATVWAIENGGFGREWMEKMHSPARRRLLGRASRWRVRRFVNQVKELE